MRELCPACPPVAVRSTSTVRSPSDAPYTAAPEPGRPAADDDEVVEAPRPASCRARRVRPARCRSGSISAVAVGGDHDAAGRSASAPAAVEQPLPLGRRRTGTSGRAPGCGRGTRAPPTSGPTSGGRRPWSRAPARWSVRLPGLEQVVDDRVELLLRRVPGLEQVVVEVDDVDRVDRGVGVGVGGEQHPAGVRVEIHRRFEELDAAHLRHPVVGEQHGDRLAAQLHLAQRVEGLLAGLGPHDAVARRRSGGAGRGRPPGTRRVVVDGQDAGAVVATRCHGCRRARMGGSSVHPAPARRHPGRCRRKSRLDKFDQTFGSWMDGIYAGTRRQRRGRT